MGGTFVAEEMPESWRIRGAGYMHTGYYVGFIFAALANFTIGTHFGWRAMFLFGGLPALLLAWIRRGVTEPERWIQKEKTVHTWSWWRPLAALFTPVLRRRTILNSLFMIVSICGLWAGTVVRSRRRHRPRRSQRQRRTRRRATRFLRHHPRRLRHHSRLPRHAHARRTPRPPRRPLFFLRAHGHFHRAHFRQSSSTSRKTRCPWFFVCLFFLGFGGANFAVYTLWLPEQYPTECRATAFAFSTSFARFIGASVHTFLVGAGVRHFGSLGTPVALTAIAFALGLFLTPLGAETKGHPLPS